MDTYHNHDTPWWDRDRKEYDECPGGCGTDGTLCGLWGMCASTASLLIQPATITVKERWGV